jgi:hypothetical protein
MFNFLRKLREIVKYYDMMNESKEKYVRDRFNTISNEVSELKKLIKERTEIDMDIGFHEPSTVIIIGRYKGQDYVKVNYLHDKDLNYIIDYIKELERFGNLIKIDAPRGFSKIIRQGIKL